MQAKSNLRMELNSAEKSSLSQVQSSSNLSSDVKTSQISSSLDIYCNNNVLDESSDFIDCNSKNKFKYGKSKKEVFSCEICKENITHLDVYGRGVHVNGCIDKQILSAPTSSSSSTQPTEIDSIFILECPLCFKNFSSPELRANHIKKCGKSKGLATQSIIKALELQERHALEREALGLPAKPSKTVKSLKNPTSKRTLHEPKSKAQSDIQLAKALSLSLEATEQTNSDIASDNSSSAITLRAPTIQQNPGKKVSKHRKGITGTPLLVLRSEEDRKKILLDKVTAIVAPVNEEDDAMDTEQPMLDKKSKKDPSEMPVLWNRCGQSSEKYDYYVEQLLDWITPSDGVEVGAKLYNLSQIAGHKIVTQLPCDYTFNSGNNNDTCTDASQLPSETSPVIGCLRSLVGSSWMSDVDVCTAYGTHLPAHKLLLAARCPPLRQDLDFCSNSEKVTLKWENISFDAALQFLNFVYTGNMEAVEEIIADLFHLAKKYEVHDLLEFLNANWKSHMPLEVKVKEHLFQETGGTDIFPSRNISSYALITEDTKSQRETNSDLEIVYNCISSSLRPTQFSIQESFVSMSRKSLEDFMETEVNNNVLTSTSEEHEITKIGTDVKSVEHSIMLKDGISELSTKVLNDENSELNGNYNPVSPVVVDVNDSDEDSISPMLENKTIHSSASKFHIENSLLDEEYNSTSPVIFDVNDSEDDVSDNENSEILNSHPENVSIPKDGDISPALDNDIFAVNINIKMQAEIPDSPLSEVQCSMSPIIFEVNDSEDNISNIECSQVLRSSIRKRADLNGKGSNLENLDLNCAKSSSSDDSVKFLSSSQPVIKKQLKSNEDFVSSNVLESPKLSMSKTIAPSADINTTLVVNLNEKEIKYLQSHSPEYDPDNISMSTRFCDEIEEYRSTTMLNKNSRNYSNDTASISKRDHLKNYPFLNDGMEECKTLPSLSQSTLATTFLGTVSLYGKLYSSPSNRSKNDQTLPSLSQETYIDTVQTSLSPEKHNFKEYSSLSDETEAHGALLFSSQKIPHQNGESPTLIHEKIDYSSCSSSNDGIKKICQRSPSWHSDDTLPFPSNNDLKKSTSPVRNSTSPNVHCSISCIEDFSGDPIATKVVSFKDPIEKARRDVISPVVISFSSDDETMHLENSYLNKELSPQKESKLDETISVERANKDFESFKAESPKLPETSSQFMDDYVFDEPYVYFELSPETVIDATADIEINNNRKADDIEREECCGNSDPDSTAEKPVATVSQSFVCNAVSKQKSSNGNSKQAATPSNKLGEVLPQFRFSDSPVTPLPDYKTMVTPDIKQALKKYGVKAMSRKKAVTLLSYIYNETHPVLNGESETQPTINSPKKTSKTNKVTNSKKRKLPEKKTEKPTKKAPLKKTALHAVGIHLSSDSDESGSENSDTNRLGCIPEMSFSQCIQDSPSKNNPDDMKLIKKYILSNEQLYSNILSYTPLNIADFQKELKNSGIKISIQKLMHFLDEQCITFTCPRNEKYQKKQTARANNFRKRMISKMSQQIS